MNIIKRVIYLVICLIIIVTIAPIVGFCSLMNLLAKGFNNKPVNRDDYYGPFS